MICDDDDDDDDDDGIENDVDVTCVRSKVGQESNLVVLTTRYLSNLPR